MSENISVLDSFLIDEEGQIEVQPKRDDSLEEEGEEEEEIESVEPESPSSVPNPNSHPARQQLSPKR